MSLVAEFEHATGLVAKQNILASRETTFRIGGLFEFFVEVNSTADLSKTLIWLRQNDQKINILGAGSNLLASSQGVTGWTIRLGRNFRFCEGLSSDCFKVGAAYSFMALSRELSSAGKSGLEFAAGIPGSVGGAVRMNAGAHKGETSSVVSSVEFIDSSGQLLNLKSSELEFSYRHCSLPADTFITSVEFKLTSGDAPAIMASLSKNLEYRKLTQPLSQPSAGSIFRNCGSTLELSAGSIIESLGLKGRKSGEAEISSLHANWIVNPKKTANSSDVVALIELCKTEALRVLSLRLQPEVIMW